MGARGRPHRRVAHAPKGSPRLHQAGRRRRSRPGLVVGPRPRACSTTRSAAEARLRRDGVHPRPPRLLRHRPRPHRARFHPQRPRGASTSTAWSAEPAARTTTWSSTRTTSRASRRAAAATWPVPRTRAARTACWSSRSARTSVASSWATTTAAESTRCAPTRAVRFPVGSECCLSSREEEMGIVDGEATS